MQGSLDKDLWTGVGGLCLLGEYIRGMGAGRDGNALELGFYSIQTLASMFGPELVDKPQMT